jgi:hypothetical protein
MSYVRKAVVGDGMFTRQTAVADITVRRHKVMCSISPWRQATVASYWLLEEDAIEGFHAESSCNAGRILANVSM